MNRTWTKKTIRYMHNPMHFIHKQVLQMTDTRTIAVMQAIIHAGVDCILGYKRIVHTSEYRIVIISTSLFVQHLIQ